MENSLRFDSNTLPFPPKSLPLFLKEMAKSCPVNEYADPTYGALKKLLAQYEDVSIDMLTITNSGDEAIDIVAKAFLNPGEKFIVSPPTYEMFSIQSKVNNGVVVEVPLLPKTFAVDEAAIIAAAKEKSVKMIFICNPNNPTGSAVPPEIIENIIKNVDCMVIIDEVYREFYGKSSNYLIKKYDNVVILRSFSKFAAMAGARIGYLIANKNLSQIFDGIRFPMGVSYLSYKLAEIVLTNDKKWMKDQAKMIVEQRKKLTNELTKLGFFVYPSQTNFLLVKFGDNAKTIVKTLKQRNIIIRDRSSKKYLEGCVRITVRSPKENKILIDVLKKIVSQPKKIAFLDRDGTLIFEPQDTFQIDSLDTLKILDGVLEGLKKLINLGYELVMISNQDGLGTKSFPKKDFDAPQNKMLQIFKENGITFKEIFICPHFPDQNCTCRKPKIGLVEKFLKENKIDTKKSFVCGDRITDKLFAKNIGVTFIQMQTNGDFSQALKKGGII